MQQNKDSLSCIGKIVGVHGLKGNLRAVFNIKHFQSIFPFVCDEFGKLLNLRYIRFLKGSVHLISLDGVAHINDAELLRNKELFLDLSNINKENEAFLELHGSDLEVWNEKGDLLGKMNGLVDFGGGELLRVSKDGNEEFILSEYVKKIDRESGKITVEEMEVA